MLRLLFWGSALFVAYAYIGYPLLLAASCAIARRLHTERRTGGLRLVSGHGLPPVTVVIAARNEAHRLTARIDNLLASDYPADRLQVIVASDGSTDHTASVIDAYNDPRVDLIELPPSGKAEALNAAVRSARSPIVVFADARQRFAPDTIRRLVARFADPGIGAVSGELLIDSSDSTIGDGVGAYWRYEKWLRRHEAFIGSTLGVTGAVYAMRRHLWRPLPPGTLLDDVLAPMRVVLEGYRVVFEDSARAWDGCAPDAATELRRKVRTLAGNFQLLTLEPRLLLPSTNPVWLQFVSHKLARLLVPYALVTLFVTSLALAGTAPVYLMAAAGQSAMYALALYGALLDRRERPVVAQRNEAYREAA